jgi:hypothetical protein
MSRPVTALAILSLAIAPIAHAAEDMGLTLHNRANTSAAPRAVGAQASVTLRLGDRRTVRDAEKVTLAFAAGPILSVPAPNSIAREHRRVAALATFKIRPGYSTSLDLGGKRLATSYTRLGAAEGEEEQQEKPKKKQSPGDKIAWVAAVAGGVMVLLVGAAAIALAANGPTD